MNTLENILKGSPEGACTNDFRGFVWFDEEKRKYLYIPDMGSEKVYPRLDGDRWELDKDQLVRLVNYSQDMRWISIDNGIDHLARKILAATGRSMDIIHQLFVIRPQLATQVILRIAKMQKEWSEIPSTSFRNH